MSISDAINNAKNKINNVYNALEAKGASLPVVRNLDHLVTTVEGLVEFHNTYEDWEYNGAGGYLNLTNYIGSSNVVKVPYTNYTNLTNIALSNKPDIIYVDCNNTPFNSAQSAFQADYNLQYVDNINVTNGATTAQGMFYDCRELRGVSVKLPSSVKTGTQMFLNCKNCTEVLLDAPGLTTMTNTFALVNSYECNVTISSPNITGVTNFWRGYDDSDQKRIFIYYRYSNGTYTPTFNAFKAAVYMGSTGNSTTSYENPRYNSTSEFRIYDITNTGGISNLPNFKVYNNGTLKYIGLGKSSNESINISETLSYKKFPDTSEEQNVLIVNMSNTFRSCASFNQPVQIPNSVTAMRGTFYECRNLNQNIQISNSITSMVATFGYCYNLNQNIQIPNSVTNMCQTFYYCHNLNQNIQIPNSVTNMYYTFHDCRSLNQNIQIPNSVTDMGDTFYGCQILNQNVQIPNFVTNMCQTFFGCYNLNQNIQIGNSVKNMYRTFEKCTNLQGTINILSNQITNAGRCFDNTSLPKNVYIPFTYSNGVNSATFNSFKTAGYLYTNGVSTNQHGVTVHDLNQ